MKPIWLNSTPEQKTILITILAMANFKPNKWEWQGKQFILQEGQFITSLDSLAKECGSGVTIRNIRTALKRFEKCGFLTNESTKTGRLITIENWETYQGNSVESDKVTDKDLTKSRQRPDKDLTTKEEGKEGKKVKKDIYSDYTENPNLLKALKDFEIMRNSMKNGKFTDQAKKLLLTELNKLADTDEKKIAILKQSIFYGWKGVFPLKQGQAQKNGFDNFEGRKYDGKALEAAWVEKSRKPTFNNFENRTYDTASLKEKLLKKGRGEL